MSNRWIQWVGMASAAALVLAATPAVQAVGDSGPPGRTDFFAAGMTVRTSTGRDVRFYLQTSERDNSIDIFGARTSSGATETHDWTFYAPRHVFATYDRSTGSGRIDAASKTLHHFGAVHLRFTQTGRWTTTDCDAGSTSSAPLAFTGSFYFRTKSSGRHPWGHAGTAKHRVSFSSKGRAVRFDGCSDQPPLPCSPGIIWQLGPLVGQPLVLDKQRVPTIDATRYYAHLGGLWNVQRLDDIVVQVAKPRTWRDANGLHVKVTGLPDTRVHGTATLNTDQPGEAHTESCLPRPNTETSRAWQSVTYRNGLHQLTVRADTGQDISVNDADTATLSRTHVD